MFKKGSNYLLIFQKKSIFQVISKKGSIIQVKLKKIIKSFRKSSMVQVFESYWTEGFYSVSHIKKKGSMLRLFVVKNLWITFKKNHFFESYSKFLIFFWVIFNEQNLWVVLKKSSIRGVLFFLKKGSILENILKRVQFYE